MIIEKKDTHKLYGVPKKIIFCKKCVISNQRPRITFNKFGICSACDYASYKRNKINWKKREEELLRLLDKHRSKTNKKDIVVPCSGGKDGSFVAHQLKFKYGMNPLCVTWSPIVPSKIGKTNLSNFIKAGFDHVLGIPKNETYKKLTALSFTHMGDPFLPFIYGQSNYPEKVAVKNNISAIMYGENGEVEYGGNMKLAKKPYKDQKYNKFYFSNFPVEYWKKYNLSKEDLDEFAAPSKKELLKQKIRTYFFGYYKFWDPQENFYYSQKNTGFQVNPDRTEGTYSKYASLDDKLDGFHFYLSYIKFGIGRATSDAAHEIRDNKITREEAIYLVKKYEHEFPKKHFNLFLKFCGIKKSDFNKIIDSWRSPHVWKKEKNHWKLINTVY